MLEKQNYAVFIGRMQPPHKSHITIIREGLEIADKVIVLVGSAMKPRSPKNPWSWTERKDMIMSCFTQAELNRIIICPIPDVYPDQVWVENVQSTVRAFTAAVTGSDPSITLIGHFKDKSSTYLRMFPQWELKEIGLIDDIHGTDIRESYFDNQETFDRIAESLPDGIHDYLKAFMLKPEYDQIIKERECIKDYKKSWEAAPFPPVFVTVDAVVVQSGHVLLVRRRHAPGAGLWAMPGGFINQSELLEDACIRELREETGLKVPGPVLKGNIRTSQCFDAPERSSRGRTITHAYLIELQPTEDGKLPKVKGMDDADKAEWIPLSTFRKMQEQMFEDHYEIINTMINKL